MTPVVWQRLESALIALAALVAGPTAFGIAWWWPLALFLAFDLSMAGYLAGPRFGAVAYNAAHSYAGPAVVVGAAALAGGSVWVAILGVSWVFHIAVDRALGYGLKLDDAFEHTHLGFIGRPRADRAGRPD